MRLGHFTTSHDSLRVAMDVTRMSNRTVGKTNEDTGVGTRRQEGSSVLDGEKVANNDLGNFLKIAV
jgi:hypothetical protein